MILGLGLGHLQVVDYILRSTLLSIPRTRQTFIDFNFVRLNYRSRHLIICGIGQEKLQTTDSTELKRGWRIRDTLLLNARVT